MAQHRSLPDKMQLGYEEALWLLHGTRRAQKAKLFLRHSCFSNLGLRRHSENKKACRGSAAIHRPSSAYHRGSQNLSVTSPRRPRFGAAGHFAAKHSACSEVPEATNVGKLVGSGHCAHRPLAARAGLRPNPSFNRTHHGMSAGPCCAFGYHAPHGPAAMPRRAG